MLAMPFIFADLLDVFPPRCGRCVRPNFPDNSLLFPVPRRPERPENSSSYYKLTRNTDIRTNTAARKKEKFPVIATITGKSAPPRPAPLEQFAQRQTHRPPDRIE